MSNVALLQFVNAKGAGDATIRRLADFVAREGITPHTVVEMRTKEIAAELETTEDVAASIVAAHERSCRQAEELESHDIDMIWLADARYPGRLRAILGEDAPSVLFVKGNVELLESPSVGFCGSRHASEKGLMVTDRSARMLAQERICIISGYAHGVDLAAHRAALKAGGETIMVLAEGILRFKEKKEIQGYLAPNNYLVVSQFPPSLTWIGRNAMKRNSTIIGLSDAVILVESGTTGGTFAAGTEALKRNQPLFVIDFAEQCRSSVANPHFIERGGIPIRGNRQHVPNLERVLEAARHPQWCARGPEPSLF